MSKIKTIPTVIYGCRVLYFGWPKDVGSELPWGVTICAGKGNGYWLVLCKDDWEPTNREFYDDLGRAKSDAEQGYKVAWGVC